MTYRELMNAIECLDQYQMEQEVFFRCWDREAGSLNISGNGHCNLLQFSPTGLIEIKPLILSLGGESGVFIQ